MNAGTKIILLCAPVSSSMYAVIDNLIMHAVFHLGNRLELLYYLVKNHCGGEQVLNIKGQDLPSVKKACMDLLTAILSPC